MPNSIEPSIRLIVRLYNARDAVQHLLDNPAQRSPGLVREALRRAKRAVAREAGVSVPEAPVTGDATAALAATLAAINAVGERYRERLEH